MSTRSIFWIFVVSILTLAGCREGKVKNPDGSVEEPGPGDDGGMPGDDGGNIGDPGQDYDEVDEAGDDGAGGDDGGAGDDGGGGDAGQDIWRPRPGTSWQWQLTGTIDTSLDVVMYDIDLFEVPQRTIDDLHADGRKVICYFSAGSWEEWRPDADDFPQDAIGDQLDDWPGEYWLDIRDDTVRDIMKSRLDLAAQKDCDGVEPDNVDGYSNDTGFDLSGGDQLDYNRFLAAEAHACGLSVGLKNDVGQVDGLLDDFDWALNEECFQWDECDTLRPFIQADKAVFHVEYGDAQLAGEICSQANALNFDTLIKNEDLNAWRISCR